ncbi:MAG: hypothetical protein M1490_00660 [Candidatus Bathyarchaeota archaeon]|nr:hypothetical protein [Candidatus Bathyarchaeota archaeon]
MVYDEGLRSYKAIAFIENVRTIGYLELGATPRRPVLGRQNPLRYLSKRLGEKIYG